MTDDVVVFLAKANDDLISHCKCAYTFIGAPAQMDCPWCGCGWLFVCPKCRKAFTFARAVECNLTREQLAHNDLDGKYGRQPSGEEVDECWLRRPAVDGCDVDAMDCNNDCCNLAASN